MRFTTPFVLLALTLPLAGCLDMEEEVWVRADGRVSYRCVLEERAGLLQIGADVSRGLRERLEKESGVRSVRCASTLEGEKRRTVIDVELEPTGDGPFAFEGFQVEPLGGGRFRVERTLGGATTVAAQKEDPFDRMLSRQLLGRYRYTLRLHAPRIERCNGTLDAAGTTAEWTVPWVDARGTTFSAEIELGGAGLGWLHAAGAIALLVGAGLVRKVMRV